MGHELMHLELFARGYTISRFRGDGVKMRQFHHATITPWQLDQARIWNYNVDHYIRYANIYKQYWGINYKDLGFYTINPLPKY